MKVATGRTLYEGYGARAQAIDPRLEWAIVESNGSWTGDAEGSDIIAFVDSACRPEFVERVRMMPKPAWLHTEDAGTDGSFYDAMRAKGTLVTHSPGANAPEVAEFAFSLLLRSAKRLGDLQRQQSTSTWEKLNLGSVSDKTALIIGLGAIGTHIARYCKAFGMRTLGIRRSPNPVDNVDELGTLDSLLAYLGEADYVLLALPSTAQSRGLLDADAFARIKPGAVLINVARGAVIHEPALLEALDRGQVKEAALDVFAEEPLSPGSPLWRHPKVFVTPHNAFSSPLYLHRVGELWLDNLSRYVKGEPLLHLAP